jgi:hypothetical protein
MPPAASNLKNSCNARIARFGDGRRDASFEFAIRLLTTIEMLEPAYARDATPAASKSAWSKPLPSHTMQSQPRLSKPASSK